MRKDNIPGYTINEIIHEGNSTIVDRAISNSDKKKVILKTLASAYPTPTEIALFTKEYETLEKIDIPGVNKVLEIITCENRPVLVMEDMGGTSLSEYIENTIFSLADFLKIAIKIADVVSRIHAKNIMHKNINPDNIIINSDTGEIRIIDFGIAAKLSRERTSVRNPNVLEGTLAYMSPEQTGRMNRSTDYRTDLYSLGITFYKMIIGKLPFESVDAMELVHCHIAKKITPPTDIKPEIPRVLSDIVVKLTAKNAEERYQSATGLKYDLEECLHNLTKKSVIPYFSIGQRDVFSKFKISEHLYGRARETESLLHLFETVANGSCQLLLISGISGMGKTALVNEIHKPSVRRNGYFISGKFDQFKSNIPFNAFAYAFSDLLKQLVSEPQHKLEKIKAELTEALGLNAAILTDLIPEFSLIIGKQPAAYELNPVESQNRFFFTLRDFIKVFATREHPLTIFLDDLQWSDDSSLSLIRELIIKEIPCLFIIGAYRNNEINDGHPLALSIEEIKKTKNIHEITLQALDKKNVNQLIADTLLTDAQETTELSDIVFKRTAGNPFYINELLKTIYHDGLINFNYTIGKWTWDIKKISALTISDNVVEFMTAKLKELPEDCLSALELAACIGNSFTLKTLTLITERIAADIAAVLWPAIESEIIVPLSDDYRLVVENHDFGVSYKFNHDRIQQAAYLIIEKSRQKALNLQIGRILLNNVNDTEKNDKIIELVRHFNEGSSLITDPAEKKELAEMNLQAGKKAQSAVAYHSALQYFKSGINLLPSTLWDTHYHLAFELHFGLAQNAYQDNNYSEAEECIALLLLKARTKLEKVAVLSLRLRQYNTIGKAEEAIRSGIEGLALLGYVLPEKPTAMLVLKEVLLAKVNLGRRKPVDLLNAPLLKDPEKKAAARLLTDIGPSAYILGNDNLYGLTQLKVVNLSLVHGNCQESSYAYIAFGTVLSEAFGDLKSAENFGRLGLRLNEKLGDIEYRCRSIAAYGVLTHHFNNHWSTTGEWFKKGIEAGYLSGDLFFLAHCAANCTVWNSSLDLSSSLHDQQKYLQVVKDTNYKDALDTATMNLQFTKNLAGLTDTRFSMNDAQFDEKNCLEQMTRRKYLSGIGMYYIHKAQIFLQYEDYEKSFEAVKEADKYVKSLVSLIYLTRLCSTAFFSCSGYLLSTDKPVKNDLKNRMRKECVRMKKWSDYYPKNFQHTSYLMEAEMADINGDLRKAGKLYDLAIKSANENNWLADEGFANELAAKFYYKNGIKKASLGYWQEAYYIFNKWGALGKTKFMEENYPQIFNSLQLKNSTFLNNEPTNIYSFNQKELSQSLDVDTIIKTSQAISGEIVLESLLSKMMDIIMMNAGAENGLLLLEQHDHLFIQAAANGKEVATMQNIPVKESKSLPQTIINYVFYLKEPVVLEDATNKGEFTKDEYIVANQPKSVLCSPVVFLNKLYGIIYLENNISVAAFSQERLKILQLLSSQMAISIQNALLYSNLEEKVQERTTELRHEKKKSDDLLSNILPEEVANELKQNGFAEAKQFDNTTVLFTDFVNFTKISESLTPKALVAEVHLYFTAFDAIIERNGLEKIKTIGDAYLAVGGMPNEDKNHAVKTMTAAVEIIDFVNQRKSAGGLFNIRIGLNSGPVVAGIVGVKKFVYDIWGDTVNTAARMESNSEPGKINISSATYELIKTSFNCTYRGMINAKSKGMIDMYFAE